MARKADHTTLIRCSECGEEYSATYRRCPFCGEKADQYATGAVPPVTDDYEDGYVFDGGDVFDDYDEPDPRTRGGKRLPSDRTDDRPINWPRVVTFICALIIIAAALVIVFSYIYPKIHTDPNKDPSTNQSQPVNTGTPGGQITVDPDDPFGDTTGDPGPVETGDPVPTDDPSQTESQPPADTSVTGLKLSKTDFTLRPDESHTIKATVSPSDWDGTVTWASSNTKIATVDKNGKVTNVNTSSTKQSVTITATAGDKTATAKVYCSGGSSGSSSSSEGSTSSGDLKLNKEDFTLYTSGKDTSTTMKVTSGDTNVTWSISDTSVATIDQNGKVTAVGKGKATITATASDGSTATCIVRVREP